MIRNRPLGMFILLVNHSLNPKVQWLAYNTLQCTVHNFGWLSSYPFDQGGSLQASVGPVCF